MPPNGNNSNMKLSTLLYDVTNLFNGFYNDINTVTGCVLA